jgi:hypothetical protein
VAGRVIIVEANRLIVAVVTAQALILKDRVERPISSALPPGLR